MTRPARKPAPKHTRRSIERATRKLTRWADVIKWQSFWDELADLTVAQGQYWYAVGLKDGMHVGKNKEQAKAEGSTRG